MVMPKGGGRSHAHGHHCLLLGDRWLAFLIRPVAANRTRSEPFPVHRSKCLLRVGALTKGNETVATRTSSLHIPHDSGLGNTSKGRERLKEHLIIDFIGEVTNEDVEMVLSVFFVASIGLVSPVHTDFLETSQMEVRSAKIKNLPIGERVDHSRWT